MSNLSESELARYERQLLLPKVGEAGQCKLKQSRIALIGAGGLGSPAALYLAAAGVGELRIIDPDIIETSNLQRQILHVTEAIGTRKAESASQRLHDLNPYVKTTAIVECLDEANATQLLAGCHIAIGCIDNFAARYAMNCACVQLGIPNIYGSVSRWEGQVGVFSAYGGPCYQCFFQEPPPDDWQPTMEEKAVIGSVPGVIGALQANEAIKLILGVGDSLSGRLLLFDALRLNFREIAIKKNSRCPVCGKG